MPRAPEHARLPQQRRHRVAPRLRRPAGGLALLPLSRAAEEVQLLHGDGHPGNVFHQAATDRFTWIDFQLKHVGPPGFELTQGLPLGLNGADRGMFERVVAAYYAAFIAAAPAGTAELYTAAECWEDFLFGIYLWGLAIPPVTIQLVRKACSQPEDDPALGVRRLGMADQVHEFRTCLRVIGELAAQRTGDRIAALFLDATHDHTKVLALDDDADALGAEHFFDGLCHLHR